MSIQSIIDYYKRVEENDPHVMDGESEMKETETVLDEFRSNTEFGMRVVLEKIDDEKFARFLHMTQKTILFMQLVNGEGGALLIEDIFDLRAYTNTVVLSVIGALINEEVL